MDYWDDIEGWDASISALILVQVAPWDYYLVLDDDMGTLMEEYLTYTDWV